MVEDVSLEHSKSLVISPLAQVTCKISHVLLAVVRCLFFFSVISRFYPTCRLTRLKMSEIILMGHKTQ